jgi:hypothetical protein
MELSDEAGGIPYTVQVRTAVVHAYINVCAHVKMIAWSVFIDTVVATYSTIWWSWIAMFRWSNTIVVFAWRHQTGSDVWKRDRRIEARAPCKDLMCVTRTVRASRIKQLHLSMWRYSTVSHQRSTGAVGKSGSPTTISSLASLATVYSSMSLLRWSYPNQHA